MPRTAARPVTAASAPPAASPLAEICAAVLSLVVAIEGQPDGSPAAKAYRSALRRKGEALSEAGGSPALLDTLARVRASDPERAAAREAVLDAAWSGIPGWLS